MIAATIGIEFIFIIWISMNLPINQLIGISLMVDSQGFRSQLAAIIWDNKPLSGIFFTRLIEGGVKRSSPMLNSA